MKKALEAIKIVIGDRIMTEKEFFSEKEKFRQIRTILAGDTGDQRFFHTYPL